MLEHPDAGHLVVHRLAGQVAVVAQLDRHPGLEPLSADAPLRVVELALAQRNAVRKDAVLPCGPADQRALTAADVEQALAGLQPELAAGVLELIALG